MIISSLDFLSLDVSHFMFCFLPPKYPGLCFFAEILLGSCALIQHLIKFGLAPRRFPYARPRWENALKEQLYFFLIKMSIIFMPNLNLYSGLSPLIIYFSIFDS